MFGRVTSLAALGLAVALSASPALAGSLPAGGVTRQEVADWLVRSGYTAKIHDDDNGVSIVTSAMSGINYDIYFFSCSSAQRCASVQYAAGWSAPNSATLEKINTWNTTKRYLKVYRGEGGAVWAEYDIDVSPGGSWEQLDHSLERYGQMLDDFVDFMDW